MEIADNIWIGFGFKILLAVLGLLIYSLMKIGDNAKLKEFDLGKFLLENKGFWFWAVSLQISVALILLIAPLSAEAIKTMVGIDFGEPMAFLTSGFFLARLANGISKDKIGTKPLE